MPDDIPTLDELDEADAKTREQSLEVTLEAVTHVLDLSKRLARLEAISDEEWAEAVAADEASEEAEGAA